MPWNLYSIVKKAMQHSAQKLVFWCISLLFCVGTASAEERPKHFLEAELLVTKVTLEDTDYEHGKPRVEWKGVEGATKFSSHTDCSGLMDALLEHSYGYTRDDFKKWFGKPRPTAELYHEKIVEKTGFQRLLKFHEAQPGDLLAVKYFVEKGNTGHVMLVAEVPKKMTPKKPLVANTDQWEVTIIDSSKSGHGNSDTRHKKGANGKDHDGLGKGVLRVYTHQAGKQEGQIAGFTWSTLSVSEFKKPEEEHLVLGRLEPNYKP